MSQVVIPFSERKVREEFRAAHAAGQRLLVWTVDDLDEAGRLYGLGVDSITTNVPDQLMKELRKPTVE